MNAETVLTYALTRPHSEADERRKQENENKYIPELLKKKGIGTLCNARRYCLHRSQLLLQITSSLQHKHMHATTPMQMRACREACSYARKRAFMLSTQARTDASLHMQVRTQVHLEPKTTPPSATTLL